MPYLVLTVVPSTSGSRSRCTPARETSAPPTSEREAILSISSRNTMPFCSTLAIAFCFISSSLISLPASSSTSSFIASLIFILRGFLRAPPMPENMDLICSVISSMPGGAMISICGPASATSISTSRSSSAPSRRRLRKVWRVLSPSFGSPAAGATLKPKSRDGGTRMSMMRSSAASSARWRTLRISLARVCLMPMSIRSRMMVSTSRPT